VAFSARILADSVNPMGNRLTTFELTFPRVILAEFNTHRMISRNAASSRAIPTEKLIQRVLDDPFIPDFRLNQKGMQAGEALPDDEAQDAVERWLTMRDVMAVEAKRLHALSVHKQYVNRLLEPWMWVTVIASATEWANLFHLRCSPEAEPSFQRIACMARDLYLSSEPAELFPGDWHLPLTNCGEGACDDGDMPDEFLIKCSVGRCARVSYLTHDGQRDPQSDIDLHDRLAASGHWSPFEHVATPEEGVFGNFVGWRQYRKSFANENVTEVPRP
jgi:hypothetical protein